MQLHIGALRDNSTRILKNVGANSGIDSMNDFNYAKDLSNLLNSLDITNELPRTILYCLNPKDLEMLSTMCGNFQSNSNGIKGKYPADFNYLGKLIENICYYNAKQYFNI